MEPLPTNKTFTSEETTSKEATGENFHSGHDSHAVSMDQTGHELSDLVTNYRSLHHADVGGMSPKTAFAASLLPTSVFAANWHKARPALASSNFAAVVDECSHQADSGYSTGNHQITDAALERVLKEAYERGKRDSIDLERMIIDAYERGKKEGIEQGRAHGRKEGVLQGRELVLSAVQEWLGVTEEDLLRDRERLEKHLADNI
ncbi:hypothetical protein BZA05DRAFT_422421 [Tricharina praecox]|uniref:uncharacterized protein n=1 Tax=Tricharina praecox TaxID=43433 RepID=UPI0022204B89|nr:uncharacterized protein BZA05DRAFT_422421 [Tricharina praecox]KAI5842782.1 hypothetical protein BZA05DRAFT_422421 [Tricharina praecox]